MSSPIPSKIKIKSRNDDYGLNDIWLTKLKRSGSFSIFNLEKLKKWILTFLVISVLFFAVQKLKWFPLKINQYLLVCSLFLFLFAHFYFRKISLGHYIGIAITSLFIGAYGLYSSWDWKFNFMTEKKISGFMILGVMVLGIAYKIRKKFNVFPILGQSRHWLMIHIYSGISALFLLLFHVNFSFPRGLFFSFLFFVFLIFIITSMILIFLQTIIPIKLADLEVEVVFEKIPLLIERMKTQMIDILNNLRDKGEISKTLTFFFEDLFVDTIISLGAVANLR